MRFMLEKSRVSFHGSRVEEIQMRHMRERMLTLCCELAGGVLHNNTLLYKYFFNEKKDLLRTVH